MDHDGRDSGTGHGVEPQQGNRLTVVEGEGVDPARYLASLNECFGAWGGEADYDLIFRRPFDGRLPDRFVLSERDEWIAGSAVSWRVLLSADGDQVPVGIMTGSWTLAAARGRGCFARIIELSREACAAKRAPWLLAFVTEANASRRQLERAGSVMTPSWYMWSQEGAALPDGAQRGLVPVEPTPQRVAECREAQALQRRGATRFHYATPELWRLQFIDRTLPTELLVDRELGLVVVERHPQFDRVLTAIPNRPDQWLDLMTAVWRRALMAGRRFFAFTTDAARHALLTNRCGLGGTGGFVTILPGSGSEGQAVPTGWLVEHGDRL